MIVALMFLTLVALILINVPIAIALGIVAMGAMVFSSGADALLNAAITMFTGATSFPLLAIPLFVLAGAIMNTSSLSRRLIAFASALLGFVRGGLAMITIGTSMFFAEISGSAVADVAAMGSVLIPAMKKKGYPKEFAAAVMSSSATLAVIIPPSIPMILYAVMADTSVVQLFVAGIVPGVLAALFIGGVIYRELNLKHLYDAMLEGSLQTAIVMLLVAASALLGIYLTEQQMPQQLATWLSSITSNRYAVLAILNVFFLLVGLFLHSAAAIILVVPIVLPLVKLAGIDPVHFGLIVTLNLGIGQQTPPVASVLMASCSIAKADMWKVTRVNLPFIGVLVATLLLVTYVPAVPMFLVDYFYR